MALMGQREYARHRKCALRAVQKAIESGRIKTVAVGAGQKIDSDQADRDWVLNTDQAKQSLLHGAGPQPGADDLFDQAPGDEPETTGPATPAEPDLYRDNRAKREKLALEREQYEFAQTKGQVLALQDGMRLAFTAFRQLRDAAMNLPARVKDQCAVLTDAHQIEQLLEDALGEVFGAFDVDKVLTESVDDDDEDPDD